MCPINNYNREKNKKRKIHSGDSNLNKNKENKVLNEIDYALMKVLTQNFMDINNNKKSGKKEKVKKKNKMNKPHTPEIKNQLKNEKENINNFNNKKNERPSTAPLNKMSKKK